MEGVEHDEVIGFKDVGIFSGLVYPLVNV